MAKRFSTGGRFARIFQVVFYSAFVIVVVYFVYWMFMRIVTPATEAQCQRNLQEIAGAIQSYMDDNRNQWPPYLTALHPKYIDNPARFICPADRDAGKQGCIPPWVRSTFGFVDNRHYVDLDGPKMDDKDKDTIPCSYLYEFSNYPCFFSFRSDVRPYQLRWSDFKRYQADWVRQRGLDARTVIPVVRCFHHLKEGSGRKDGPTFNILMSLAPNAKQYPYEWQLEFPALQSAPPPAATPKSRSGI